MTGYRAGDQREAASLTTRIDHLITAAELARELKDYRLAGDLLRGAVELHRSLTRLEKAVVFCEAQAATEAAWGKRVAS